MVMDCIHFIWHYQFKCISSSVIIPAECQCMQSMFEELIVYWPASFWSQWQWWKAVVSSSNCRVPPHSQRSLTGKMYAINTSHYGDVIVDAIASQITSLTIVYSIVYSDADQRKHQSSTSLAFVQGIHRGPVNSPHKWPVTRQMFPVDDVIMNIYRISCHGNGPRLVCQVHLVIGLRPLVRFLTNTACPG